MEAVKEYIDIDDFENFHISLFKIEQIPRLETILIEITPDDIILENKEGEKLLLSSLLPWNCFFQQGIDFIYRSYLGIESIVEYPISAIDKSYFFIYLLHEIGHAHDKTVKRRQENSYHQMRTTIGIGTVFLVDFIEDIKKWITELITRKSHTSNKYLRTKKLEERFAWNFALRKYRELKNEWWDLSGWLSDKQILDIVRYALLSYEYWNINRFPWEKYTKMTNRKRLKLK